MKIRSVYDGSPTVAQNVAVSYVGWRNRRKRYGKEFRRALGRYEERAHFTADEISNFRRAKLREQLTLAARTPHYRGVFDSLGISPTIGDPEDVLRALPILTKVELTAETTNFLTRRPTRRDDVISTSGTTGSSLSLPVSHGAEIEQWALWWRYRRNHSIGLQTPLALFASAPVVPHAEQQVFWRSNWPERETRYSVYHISRENIPQYVKNLNRERKPWIHGNPSALALLARGALDLGLTSNCEVDYVTTGSENLTTKWANTIEQFFGVRPIQHYGLAEPVANASQCKRGNLHVDEDFSWVEFLETDEPCIFRMVGTSFVNKLSPLLRYDTGDLVRLDESSCQCANTGRLISEIDGRAGDYVVLPNGSRVASLASPFHATPGLHAAQLFQPSRAALVVRFVQHKDGYVDTTALEGKLRERVGNQIAISFEKFERLPLTERGKQRLVVSNISES